MSMLTLLWAGWIGWTASAAVNYLSDVLPRTRKMSLPVCLHCGQSRSWLSILYPGRCGSCGQDAALRHWLVFISGPLISVLVWHYPSPRLGYYSGMAWLTFFGLVAVIDIEHRLILHPVSLIGALGGAVYGTMLHGGLSTLAGGIGGFGIMLGFYFLGGLFVRWMSNRRGETIDEIALGFGDVNLAGIMGLLLGWPGVLAGLFLAIILGGLGSGVYLLTRLITRSYRAYDALPYGPFLIASVIYFLYIFPYLS